mmetsp:Transcript_7418/g.17640  ORF Transcript_7418/g.17640 Transcript_7418/m.17640 type:complete len:518 (+) Transcript_7418:1472-3025(+)
MEQHIIDEQSAALGDLLSIFWIVLGPLDLLFNIGRIGFDRNVVNKGLEETLHRPGLIGCRGQKDDRVAHEHPLETRRHVIAFNTDQVLVLELLLLRNEGAHQVLVNFLGLAAPAFVGALGKLRVDEVRVHVPAHQLKLGLHPERIVVPSSPDGLADLVPPRDVVLVHVSGRGQMADAVHRPNDGIDLGIGSAGGVEVTSGLLPVLRIAKVANLVDHGILVNGNVLVRGLGDGIAKMQNDVGRAAVMEDGKVDKVAAVGMKDRVLLLVTLEQTILRQIEQVHPKRGHDAICPGSSSGGIGSLAERVAVHLDGRVIPLSHVVLDPIVDGEEAIGPLPRMPLPIHPGLPALVLLHLRYLMQFLGPLDEAVVHRVWDLVGRGRCVGYAIRDELLGDGIGVILLVVVGAAGSVGVCRSCWVVVVSVLADGIVVDDAVIVLQTLLRGRIDVAVLVLVVKIFCGVIVILSVVVALPGFIVIVGVRIVCHSITIVLGIFVTIIAIIAVTVRRKVLSGVVVLVLVV